MIYCEWTLLHKSFFSPCHLQLQTLLFSNFHHLQPTNISHAMVHWWCTPPEMLLLLHIIIAYWIVEVNEAFALIYHQFLKGCVMFGPLVVVIKLYVIWIEWIISTLTHLAIFCDFVVDSFLKFFYVVGTMCTFGSINSFWVACSRCLCFMNPNILMFF